MWCLLAMGDKHRRVIESSMQVLLLERSLMSSYCLTSDRELLSKVAVQTGSEAGFYQVIPAKLVLDWRQLELPALLTFESFMRGVNISKKIWLQYLLYFCGSRQIKECINNLRSYQEEPFLVARFSLGKHVPVGKSLEGRTIVNEVVPKCESIGKENVGLYADLSSVIGFYGIKARSLEGSITKASLLRKVLTRIAYSKLEIA